MDYIWRGERNNIQIGERIISVDISCVIARKDEGWVRSRNKLEAGTDGSTIATVETFISRMVEQASISTSEVVLSSGKGPSNPISASIVGSTSPSGPKASSSGTTASAVGIKASIFSLGATAPEVGTKDFIAFSEIPAIPLDSPKSQPPVDKLWHCKCHSDPWQQSMKQINGTSNYLELCKKESLPPKPYALPRPCP